MYLKPKYNFYIPGIHPIINERIDHGIGHSEPVEAQIDVLSIFAVDDLGVVVNVDEVSVVRQPTESENEHYKNEHLDNLQQKNVCQKV